MGSSGVSRVGMMLGATVIVLLIRLPHAPWVLLVGGGVAVATALSLAALLPVVARAAPGRLAVGAAAVIGVAAVAAAAVLVVLGVSTELLGIVVIALGAAVARVAVTVVERTIDAGPLAVIAGSVAAVAYALTTTLAVVSGTTGSLLVTLVLGVLVGIGEGVLAGRLLRGEVATAGPDGS